jgi:transcription termination factor Rho
MDVVSSFLRLWYLSPDGIYLSTSQIRLFGLKTGDTVKGVNCVRQRRGEIFFPLVHVFFENKRS